jgi:hypothetical protein
VFLGFISPIGKTALLNAIIIVQIIVFTLFQFNQIPFTYFGFKKLFLSNGLNDLTLDQTGINSFPKMQFENTLFISNYNLSFFIFCMIPIFIGFCYLLYSKIFNSGSIHN